MLVVRKVGHRTVKTKMVDFEVCVLIGWLANTLASQPIRTCASKSNWLFSKLVNATQKCFCMVVNNPLSRGLGNITKVYLITCGQSTCSKLKKHGFCQTLAWKCPYIHETLAILLSLQYTKSSYRKCHI